MTTSTIRNVDAAIKERLRVRAAPNGRSMEAELRQILSDTLAPESSREPNLAEAIRRRFAPLRGVNLDLHARISVCHGVGGMFAASSTIIMSNDGA
jgi:plasmid stability protein